MGKQMFSQHELTEYLKLHSDANETEIAAVREWMRDGFSPYENGNGICDEKGRTMDFISAMRFDTDRYQQFMKTPEAFQSRTAQGMNYRPGAPDLPF